MMTRKLVTNIILILTILVFIGGCATTKLGKEPDETLDTLLVGQLRLSLIEFPGKYGFKDTYTQQIALYLENTSTGAVIRLFSKGEGGYFILINPSAGKYKIVKFWKQTRSTHWRGTWEYPITGAYMQIADGKVNNFGLTELTMTYFPGDIFKGGIIPNRSFDDTKTLFKEKYPESAWLEKEWLNVEIFSE